MNFSDYDEGSDKIAEAVASGRLTPDEGERAQRTLDSEFLDACVQKHAQVELERRARRSGQVA